MIRKAPHHIAMFAIATLLLAQLGIAQHSAVHFVDHAHDTHSTHSEHPHRDHHNDDHDSEKDSDPNSAHLECGICLTVQSASLGLECSSTYLCAAIVANINILNTKDHISFAKRGEFYSPRAPPFFFI